MKAEYLNMSKLIYARKQRYNFLQQFPHFFL